MNLKTILRIIGFTSILSTGIIWLITFYIAFFNGFQVVININRYHEAYIEFVWGLITFISLFYFTVGFIKGECNRTSRNIEPIEKKEVLA